MPMDCTYRFRLKAPGTDPGLSLGIRQSDSRGALFNAVFNARRRALQPATVARLLLASPLMTVKVTAAIHFEAMRLWLEVVGELPARQDAMLK